VAVRILVQVLPEAHFAIIPGAQRHAHEQPQEQAALILHGAQQARMLCDPGIGRRAQAIPAHA